MLENALDVAVIIAEVALPLNAVAVAVQTYKGYTDKYKSFRKEMSLVYKK